MFVSFNAVVVAAAAAVVVVVVKSVAQLERSSQALAKKAVHTSNARIRAKRDRFNENVCKL